MNTFASKTFIVYCDPGHAWIAVPRNILVELGILEKISSFSYQRGNMVYLEEDSDAVKFAMAFAEKYGVNPELVDNYTQQHSRIRGYDLFRAEG